MDHPVSQRLLAMGLLPGTEVAVVQVAPLGDPVEIEFRGMRLSLRRADAAAVDVERLD
jgi:ferrous iron transport protein A